MQIIKKITLIIALSLASCASDNVHMPKPELMPDDVNATGEIVSGIPAFPFFEPIHCPDTALLKWANPSATRCSLLFGEFSLYVDVVDLHITIGDMLINDIAVTYDDNGVGHLLQPAFECQAGQYFTRGSLAGEYYPAKDSLAVIIDYKPGSMPFTVHSEFFGKQ